ncbi:type II toxin-antitoxin system PemK/MazF family toxin [Paenibacillus xylanexedens]|uniref:type II toxin-antitoxin system PemK/MazF family toxin n=1 Tax=Paenibacillus xylanexedens TaxID=528191 RepID=UPI000F51B481|nr:type II toxin-antitoxin system PemK/MazF family toxin [Paenibacillus xylanexedens]
MSRDPEISEVWSAAIYYKGTSGTSKIRPVLIVNINEESDIVTIQEITGVKPDVPPTYYDDFKQLITKWKETGLKKKSWVKCAPTNTHNISKLRLGKLIGIADEDDFEAIIDKIIESKERYELHHSK